MYDNRLSNQYKDICLELKSVIKKNTLSIKEIIAYTDQYYGRIADSLPEIEENINNSIDETKALINYFNNNETINKQQLVYEVFTDLRNKIEEINNFFDNKADLFIVLNSIISAKEGEKDLAFNKIISLTNGLKKLLNQLKVLAINSSIYTYNNQYQQANGFNVISETIHRISLEMGNNYHKIEKYISKLITWHKDFQNNLEEVISIEETIRNKYKGNLKVVFCEFFNFLDKITVLLEELMGLINMAISPVYELMTEIQNQDIIRQNLENINKILIKTGQEIDKGFNNKNDKMEIIDRLNFILEVINLLNKLMSTVQNEVNKSQENIRLFLGKVKENLNKVDSSLDELKVPLSFDRDNMSPDITDDIYNKIYSLLPQIQNKVREVKNSYINLLNSEEIFQTSIDEIDKEFHLINGFTDQLKTIRVLAGIELKRIMDENNFIKKIEKVINQLNIKNNDNINTYNDIQNQLKLDFNKFYDIASNTNQRMESFDSDLDDSQNSLRVIEDTINEKASNLNIEVDELKKTIDYLINDRDKFVKVTELSQQFNMVLKELENKIKKIKAAESDNIKSDNHLNDMMLNELFKEFTSYQERKTAADQYQDIDIDVGDNGGELTLF